jgi:hypothetical protein
MIRMLQEFRENQQQESVVIGTIRSINELQPTASRRLSTET